VLGVAAVVVLLARGALPDRANDVVRAVPGVLAGGFAPGPWPAWSRRSPHSYSPRPDAGQRGPPVDHRVFDPCWSL